MQWRAKDISAEDLQILFAQCFYMAVNEGTLLAHLPEAESFHDMEHLEVAQLANDVAVRSH